MNKIHFCLLLQYYQKARAAAVTKCFPDVAAADLVSYLPDKNDLVSLKSAIYLVQYHGDKPARKRHLIYIENF